MIMAILKDGVIDRKTKELLILKATQRTQCQYCVVQHERVSNMLGIEDAKIADLDGDTYKTSEHYNEGEKALLDLTVQIGKDANRVPPLHADGVVAELGEALQDEAVLDGVRGRCPIEQPAVGDGDQIRALGAQAVDDRGAAQDAAQVALLRAAAGLQFAVQVARIEDRQFGCRRRPGGTEKQGDQGGKDHWHDVSPGYSGSNLRHGRFPLMSGMFRYVSGSRLRSLSVGRGR